jgi:16S rRNA (guanine966-N2)-methyltransferase
MRIVGGRWKGTNLRGPSDRRVRPTAEAVRAALLDRLAPELAGARVLDLFAGSGALGLEALSRGAAACDFVETRESSLSALRSNIIACRSRERTRVFVRDALPYAAMLTVGAYHVAFCDPPYESRMLDRVIDHWMASHFALVLACEHARTHDGLPPGDDVLALDDTVVTLYRAPAGTVVREQVARPRR